jgi:hypothetical protein
VATDGIVGFYMETTNFGATAAFWTSLGYEKEFETDHSSGQFTHPNGGPYLFIAERPGPELETHPILWVADSTSFAPERAAEYAKPFTPEHWGVVEATVLDPDGRPVSVQAPLPEGLKAPAGH